MLDLAGGGVLVEGVGDLGVCNAELLIDQQKFEDAGRIGRQEIDLQSHLGHDDLHDEAYVRDLVQHLFRALEAITGTKAGFMLVSAIMTAICSSVIHFSNMRYSAQSGVIL